MTSPAVQPDIVDFEEEGGGPRLVFLQPNKPLFLTPETPAFADDPCDCCPPSDCGQCYGLKEGELTPRSITVTIAPIDPVFPTDESYYLMKESPLFVHTLRWWTMPDVQVLAGSHELEHVEGCRYEKDMLWTCSVFETGALFAPDVPDIFSQKTHKIFLILDINTDDPTDDDNKPRLVARDFPPFEYLEQDMAFSVDALVGNYAPCGSDDVGTVEQTFREERYGDVAFDFRNHLWPFTADSDSECFAANCEEFCCEGFTAGADDYVRIAESLSFSEGDAAGQLQQFLQGEIPSVGGCVFFSATNAFFDATHPHLSVCLHFPLCDHIQCGWGAALSVACNDQVTTVDMVADFGCGLSVVDPGDVDCDTCPSCGQAAESFFSGWAHGHAHYTIDAPLIKGQQLIVPRVSINGTHECAIDVGCPWCEGNPFVGFPPQVTLTTS